MRCSSQTLIASGKGLQSQPAFSNRGVIGSPAWGTCSEIVDANYRVYLTSDNPPVDIFDMPSSSAGSETFAQRVRGSAGFQGLGSQAEATSPGDSDPERSTVSAVKVWLGTIGAKRHRPDSAESGRDAEEPPSQRLKTDVEVMTANWEGDTIADTRSPTEVDIEPLTDDGHHARMQATQDPRRRLSSASQRRECTSVRAGTTLEAGIIGSCSRGSCGRD